MGADTAATSMRVAFDGSDIASILAAQLSTHRLHRDSLGPGQITGFGLALLQQQGQDGISGVGLNGEAHGAGDLTTPWH